MMPEDVIRDKCWKAERLGFEITPFRPGLQFHQNGYYVPATPTKLNCTILEAVLLGEENCSGHPMPDAARILNVSQDWLQGFLAGQNVALVRHTPDVDIRNGDVRKFNTVKDLLADLKKG